MDKRESGHPTTIRHTKFDIGVEENNRILIKCGYDMTCTTAGNKDSTMWYDSESRPLEDLGDLLGYQTYWGCLECNMKESVKYPMLALPGEEQ
eukprot:6031314-Ditylum_brightwellii.AAC.1